MGRFSQDLTVSFRRLRSSPGFTVAAIVTLALGIGANTAIFTAVNTLVFRPLPVQRPDELVFFNAHLANSEYPVESYPNYLDFRDRNNVLSGLAAYRFAPLNFSRGNSINARIWSDEVSGNYFEVLGVNALIGRTIEPQDDAHRGASPVAVMTYGCWQRRFAADPGIVGRTIKLNGMDYTIIGVTPRDFRGTEVVFTPELFVPMSMEPQIEAGYNWLDNRSDRNLFVIGRRKSGVNMPQAQAAINVIASDLGREHPKENAGIRIVLSAPGLFGSFLRSTVREFAAVLMGLAGMVLLIACVNLASLLLARAADRRKETAIRLALGASRGQLIRQLLTESVVLSILGGAAGLLLAFWLTRLLTAWHPPVDLPVVPPLGVDVRVMTFAALASLTAGIVFGLAPAVQSTRTDVAPALKNEAVAERLRKFPLRDALVAAQVALSVVLVIGSVLVVRSLQHALDLHLGFEPRHAASISFDTGLQGYNASRSREFMRHLLDRVRAMPGIEAAGVTSGLPLTLNWSNSGIMIEGQPLRNAAETPLAAMFDISPGYLRATGTLLVSGRDFDDQDKQDARRVVLVNEAFVRQLLPGRNPIGVRFRHDSDKDEWWTIAGVVEDGKYRSLGERPTMAVFRPIAQTANPESTLVARSSLPEDRIVALLRRAVAELDSTMPVYAAGSLQDQLGLVLFPARIAAIVLGAFGVLALVLAATGVYGIMAYAVARRTREIGIRMALGANPGQVIGVVLSHTAILLVAGMAIGLGLSLAAGRLFSQILYGISATDPLTYAVGFVTMALVAFAACLFPVRRAIRVDPVTALRTE